jgi:tRNA(adenine34) deaminase
MWIDLAAPWQACLEEAWTAYCAGSIPIGAVVTSGEGKMLSRGRNHIWDTAHPDAAHQDASVPPGQVGNTELAHAELNALLALGVDQGDRRSWALYTTTEPCPLCMGAFYMSGIRTLHYACRDPWAGSTNLLGTTPYLRRKAIQVTGPEDPRLEAVIVALFVEWELHLYRERLSVVREGFQIIVPQGVRLGTELYRSGDLRQMASDGVPAGMVYDRLLAGMKLAANFAPCHKQPLTGTGFQGKLGK